MALHPRPDAQLCNAVAGGRVDVVDAVTHQHSQRSIRLALRDRPESGRSKDRARTRVAGTTKGLHLDHSIPPISRPIGQLSTHPLIRYHPLHRAQPGAPSPTCTTDIPPATTSRIRATPAERAALHIAWRSAPPLRQSRRPAPRTPRVHEQPVQIQPQVAVVARFVDKMSMRRSHCIKHGFLDPGRLHDTFLHNVFLKREGEQEWTGEYSTFSHPHHPGSPTIELPILV